MIVSILKARSQSPEAAKQICGIFSQSVAIRQEPGWLRGNCMTNVHDPSEVLIVEEWGTQAALDAWRHSPSASALRDQSAPYLATEFVESVYQD